MSAYTQNNNMRDEYGQITATSAAGFTGSATQDLPASTNLQVDDPTTLSDNQDK